MVDFKLGLVISCFNPKRLHNFLPLLHWRKMGCPADLIFVHNKLEISGVENRYVRKPEEVREVTKLIYSFNYNGVKSIIERENVGEDMGAYHHVFNLFMNYYSHMFFLNEAATIVCDNWLSKIHEGYDFDPSVVAVTPQVCPSTTHPYCLTSTFWGMKTDFGRLIGWPTPKSREDCESQEMSLIWPQAHSNYLKIAQVGSGEDILFYKNKHYLIYNF